MTHELKVKDALKNECEIAPEMRIESNWVKELAVCSNSTQRENTNGVFWSDAFWRKSYLECYINCRFYAQKHAHFCERKEKKRWKWTRKFSCSILSSVQRFFFIFFFLRQWNKNLWILWPYRNMYRTHINLCNNNSKMSTPEQIFPQFLQLHFKECEKKMFWRSRINKCKNETSELVFDA